MKKTLVIGASPNPERYAYLATSMLQEYGHEVIPYGLKKGSINGLSILNEFPKEADHVDTVTLYLNPANQKNYVDQILALRPKRVIFNPGTENPAFEEKLQEQQIEAIEACTLVLLRTHRY
jgi:predicted CoA-binding protein